jgi:hypothetical protein
VLCWRLVGVGMDLSWSGSWTWAPVEAGLGWRLIKGGLEAGLEAWL